MRALLLYCCLDNRVSDITSSFWCSHIVQANFYIQKYSSDIRDIVCGNLGDDILNKGEQSNIWWYLYHLTIY